MASTPQARDVVVLQRARPAKASQRYVVSVVGRPEQYSEATYEQALNRADSFARHEGVDVWYTEDGAAFRSITRRRVRPA